VCGSGAQAIATAALEIAVGYAKVAIAGGMENMDQAPYLVPGGRWGHRMGDATMLDSMLRDGLHDAFSGQHSGWHTEDLVSQYGIAREDQDCRAARSQQRFSAAQAAGRRQIQRGNHRDRTRRPQGGGELCQRRSQSTRHDA
jgi:acetyl-CoA C-acetyltransferase